MATKKITALASGVNGFLNPVTALNRFATDFIIQGVAGYVGNTSGVAPATGSLAVNAQGAPNMTVAVSSGNGYIRATPTGSEAQTLAFNTDASENVTIAPNSSGSTKYDFIYALANATKLNDPAVDGTDVLTFYAQRSTTKEADSNGVLANSVLLAVVTVTNGAVAINNADIADCRMPLSGGWQAVNDTFTYSSADAPTFVITVSSDARGRYQVGGRIALWQGSWKYFIITAVSATTITVYGGTDYTLTSAGISNPMYSAQKSPIGFPMDPAKWTVKVTDTTSRLQSPPTLNVWYNLGSQSITIPIGIWNVDYTVHGYASLPGSDHYITLSTGAATESNNEYSVRQDNTAGAVGITSFKQFQLSVAVKTPYYLNTKTGTSGGTLYNNNDQVKLIIRAVCAYL